MNSDDFVHLHNHLDYSILDGAGKAKEYVAKAVENGQKAIGVSDHGTVSGVYDLIREARKADIIPVAGCEFYVAPQNPLGAKAQSPIYYGKGGAKGKHDVSGNGAFTHQTVWAINNAGLKNLFQLSTLSYSQDHFYSKPRIDLNMLLDHSEGLIVASGCPSSEISTRFLMGQDSKAYEYATRLKEAFGERFFIEIMEHHMKSPIERILLPKQIEMSRRLEIPLLCTNDVHYTHAHDHTHHEELLCSQSEARMTDTTWDQGGPRFAFDGNEFYLKSQKEMAQLFPEQDFPGALTNTLVIAEMAQDITLDYDPSLKPKSILPEGHTEGSYFKELIEEGFQRRYGNSSNEVKAEGRRRITEEFEVIYSSNFIGYFLTVSEYINWARDKYSTRDDKGNVIALSVGPGRGSSGGSIIAYCLNITELDPIRHDLLFARFLSEGRGDTYEIVYDDGTTEQVIVSEQRSVKTGSGDETKYIHQLEAGDTIEFVEADFSEGEEVLTNQPEVVQEKLLSITPVVNKKKTKTSTITGPVPEDQLTNLDLVSF
jgi:DNA polymerase-3 subunit alpha